MNKEELLEQIKSDLDINVDNIESKMFEIVNLHSKYLRLYFKTKDVMNKKKKDLDILYYTLYYKIKDNADEILTSKEIIFNVLGNSEYAEFNLEYKTISNLVDILDRTLKKINTISFDIKNIIEYKKFVSGVL